jgi:glycerol-3-phosphate dehydrogenase
MSESESVYDLLIIGAGINGAALARLASRNNIKVLVVEKHDIAKGASSASSKLIHGGLRYLEQRDIPLVSESIAERKVLKDTAPHLVTTSPFLFPQTEHNRHPKFLARLGLWFPELLRLSDG